MLSKMKKDDRLLRACLSCSLVKTFDQFQNDGCDNCEEFLFLKNNPFNVLSKTSQFFDGFIENSEKCPDDNWFCKWQQISKFKPGVYAIFVKSQDENLTQFSTLSQNLASQNQQDLSPIHQRALGSQIEKSTDGFRDRINNTSAYFSQTLANDEMNLSQEDMTQFFATEFSPVQQNQRPKETTLNNTSAYFSQNLTNDTTTSRLHIDTTSNNLNFGSQKPNLSQNNLRSAFLSQMLDQSQEPNLSQNNQSGAFLGQNLINTSPATKNETLNFSQNQFLPNFGNQEPNLSQNNHRNAFLSQNVANTPTTSNNMTMSSSYAELREIYKNRPPSKVNISSSDLSQTRVYSSSQNTNTPSQSEKSAPQLPPKYKPTFGRKFSATPGIQSYKNPYKQNQSLNNQSQNITPSFGITPNFNVQTPK